MRLIENIEELDQALLTIRRQSVSPVMNLFVDRAKLSKWIQQRSLSYVADDSAILLIHADDAGDFCRLFFVASSNHSPGNLLTLVCDELTETIVTDLIGPATTLTPPDSPLRRLFADQGFQVRSTLHRMVVDLPLKTSSNNKELVLEPAVETDIPMIQTALRTDFDPFVDQFPAQSAWDTAIRNEDIIVCRRNGVSCGFLQRDSGGAPNRIKYWYVLPGFRGQKVGSALMQNFCQRNPQLKRMLLWVKEENQKAIAAYQHYGFRVEGLVDYVYLRESQVHER